nr:glycosyltransferase [Acetobacter nitrogenifigens]
MCKKVENFFPFDRYVERLLHLVVPSRRRISVVVLSYNYARYLAGRLATIFAQHYPIFEIIVLDDASTDDSVTVAQATAEEWDRNIRVVVNRRGSGSVFAQWRRAAAEARGDWVWIAEADDLAEPDFLGRLCAALDAAPEGVMAFSDSRAIDSDGVQIFESYKPYCASVAGDVLDRDGVHMGATFVAEYLSERNLILNASSVLFRRDALQDALSRCGELETFEAAGDWRLYIELLKAPGVQVAYVAEPLNAHRRHEKSVTGKMPSDKQLDEITRIHHLVGRMAIDVEGIGERQRLYREELMERFGLTETRALSSRRKNTRSRANRVKV